MKAWQAILISSTLLGAASILALAVVFSGILVTQAIPRGDEKTKQQNIQLNQLDLKKENPIAPLTLDQLELKLKHLLASNKPVPGILNSTSLRVDGYYEGEFSRPFVLGRGIEGHSNGPKERVCYRFSAGGSVVRFFTAEGETATIGEKKANSRKAENPDALDTGQFLCSGDNVVYYFDRKRHDDRIFHRGIIDANLDFVPPDSFGVAKFHITKN